ncbi:hypothetical protein [Thauera linaloolentis]|uniref:DUF2946 domain-containing protein n=1 Tax=Thauera linaloolentis (strain DSM 12138 / JCM 21573 / CCUG 41526 / CIP 105981 / IAM 15112 / NBRC 102519 / 47Lol) TaxID=1123367 RepID=N6Z7W4_THAL4|nr:hypothetical protein [Thauera linaloolentis]ENO88254.1 hypothetical protein C666_09340 [Thauera linaloolentis 47Lol = DSM 12138]MCM8566829.1 hypothetical protein [Thauera linaloolentis]
MFAAARVSRLLVLRRLPRAGRIAARLAWALALALALLGVQALAQAHLLGHATDALQDRATMSDKTGDAGQDPRGSDDDHASACLECLALIGIDMPLGGSAAVAGHAAASLRQPAAALLPSPDALLPRPRCRAPPGCPPFALLA